MRHERQTIERMLDRGREVPGDCEGARLRSVDRGQRGREAQVRHLAAGALRRAGARRRGAGGRVPAPGVVAEVLQRVQPPEGQRLLEAPPGPSTVPTWRGAPPRRS